MSWISLCSSKKKKVIKNRVLTITYIRKTKGDITMFSCDNTKILPSIPTSRPNRKILIYKYQQKNVKKRGAGNRNSTKKGQFLNLVSKSTGLMMDMTYERELARALNESRIVPQFLAMRYFDGKSLLRTN